MENSSLPKGTSSKRLPNQCPTERAGVVDRQTNIDEHMAEDLRQIRGLAVERIAVQQQHRHSTLLGRAEERSEQQRICAKQIDVGIAVADMDLQRYP